MPLLLCCRYVTSRDHLLHVLDRFTDMIMRSMTAALVRYGPPNSNTFNLTMQRDSALKFPTLTPGASTLFKPASLPSPLSATPSPLQVPRNSPFCFTCSTIVHVPASSALSESPMQLVCTRHTTSARSAPPHVYILHSMMCRLKYIWQHSYLFLNFFAPILLQAAGFNIQLAEALSAGASTNTTQVNVLNPYLLVIQHCIMLPNIYYHVPHAYSLLAFQTLGEQQSLQCLPSTPLIFKPICSNLMTH